MTLNEASIIDAFKNDEALKEQSKKISDGIITKTYDVSSFVEFLGFALTSPTIEMRVNGTKLLSWTLSNLPKDFLSDVQLNFITTFYCDRLKDNHNVVPAVLDGILALIDMSNIPDGTVTRLFSSLFQHTTCQSQLRDDRRKYFEIIKTSSVLHINELKQMGSNFVYGVINSIDGERDPRNLAFLYDFMPDFIHSFPLQHLAEEMFEIFACYFPIDFNPSKTDPASITREELANKLANCLVSSEEFAEWAIDLLIEKLESDLIVAKLDSLDLLIRCAENFQPKTIETYFDKIWMGLKIEIFPGNDNKEIKTAGLKALRKLLETLSSNREVSKNAQTTILSTILTHLSDANHLLFAPSSSIALVCASGDPLFASDKILNALLLKIEGDSNTEQRIKLFTLVGAVLKICSEKKIIKEMSPETLNRIENQLITFIKTKWEFPELLNVVLNCTLVAIQFFSETNREIFYIELNHLMIDEKCKIDLRQILKECAKNFPEETKMKLINNILNNFEMLPENVKQQIYFNLTALLKIQSFESIILDLIMINIFEAKSIENQKLALDALRNLLETEVTEDLVEKLYRNYEILPKIIKLVRNENLNYNILSDIATILNLIVRNLKIKEQTVILNEYLPDMKLNTISDLFLTKGILAFMHEDVNMDQHFENLLNDLIDLSLNTEDEHLRESCHYLLCSLMNKIDNTEANKKAFQKCLEKLKSEIKKENKRAVEILSWISKGLIVRGYPDAGELIETLAELLEHPTLSHAALLSFEIISWDIPLLHLPYVKYLYKQKYFHTVLNKLYKKLWSFSETHINAFVYVLQMTPHSVLKMNLEKIGPILFKCLEIDKTTTVLISLNIIKKFLINQDDYFVSHLSHLIPKLLNLSQRKDSMKIRIVSINCLEMVCKYPIFVLVPFKFDVAFGLNPALDDKKRLVRNAAAKTRNIWYLIGSSAKE